MHPNPDVDLDPDAAPCLVAEPGHLAGDFQAGMHRTAHIILVGDRVTEYRQHAVTLSRSNVPLIPVHGVQHLLAIAAHEESVRLGLDPSRQHRRIHQIGEEDR